MARKSQFAREAKRKAMYEKYRGKRNELKAALKVARGNPAEIMRLQLELAKLPNNSSPTRLKNRCFVTGRSRGYIRKFGVQDSVAGDQAQSGQFVGRLMRQFNDSRRLGVRFA